MRYFDTTVLLIFSVTVVVQPIQYIHAQPSSIFTILHSVVTTKLYQSLIYPFLTYGISSWGQASSNLQKLLLLQKRALRLMTFSNQSEHAIPCFLNLYVESIASLMYDVHNNLAPDHIRQLF